MQETITILINEETFETSIDEHGTRFPNYKILELLMGRADIDMIDLTTLVNDGRIPASDRRFIYQNTGCSVCHYAETFPEDKIENPLWDD